MKMLSVLLLLALAGCATPDRLRLDAIPKPEQLRTCLDGPFGIEYCLEIPLHWDPVRQQLDDRELRKLREEEMRQRLEEQKRHSNRAVA